MSGRLVPGEAASRIIEGIADEGERESVEEVVRRAPELLRDAAYALNGHRSLSDDALRRMLDAIGAESATLEAEVSAGYYARALEAGATVVLRDGVASVEYDPTH